MFQVRDPIKEGSYTETLYEWIRDGKHKDVCDVLVDKLADLPKESSRAAWSLLGFCQAHMQDFKAASQSYEELCRYNPDVVEYKVYHAEMLYKAGMFIEAWRACQLVDHPKYTPRMLQLKAAIKFEQDEIKEAESLVDR